MVDPAAARRSGGSGGRVTGRVGQRFGLQQAPVGVNRVGSAVDDHLRAGVVDGAVGQLGPPQGRSTIPGMCPSDTPPSARGDGDRRDRGYGPGRGGPSRGSGRGPPRSPPPAAHTRARRSASTSPSAAARSSSSRCSSCWSRVRQGAGRCGLMNCHTPSSNRGTTSFQTLTTDRHQKNGRLRLDHPGLALDEPLVARRALWRSG